MSKRIKLILVFSFIFLLLVLANYFINLHILKGAINDLQVNMLKNASSRIDVWMEEKIDAVSSVKKQIYGISHIDSKNQIKDIIKHSSPVANFSHMFIGYKDNKIITSKLWEKPFTYYALSRPWYKETIINNSITITEPYEFGAHNSLAVGICTTTIKDKGDEEGVLCGVLPLTYIQKVISNIALPYDGSIFLVNKSLEIFVHKDKKRFFSTFKYKLDTKHNLITDKYIFSKAYIEHGGWHLVLQLDKDKVYEKVNFQLKINLILYGISLVIYLSLNIFHNRQQRESEEKLKISQSLIRGFMESDDRGFLVADDSHNVTYYNKEFAKLLGMSESNIYKMNLSKCFTLFKTPSVLVCDSLNKMISETKEKQKILTNTFPFSFGDTKVFLLFTSIPIKNIREEYKGMILTIEEITKKELEKKLKKEKEDLIFQQTKMADLGEMLGAIAHQWRQPLNSLSILLGNLLQFKEMGCLDDETFKENLTYALSNTQYLSNTIDTFQNFYLPNKDKQIFNIVEAINEANIILEPYFKNSGIKIDFVQNKNFYECYSFKNEFQQIITSLVLNARDALLEQENKKNMNIKITIYEIENHYRIGIEDNGYGISMSIKTDLFTLFKTTKGDKGTGTGLYISQIIAREKLLGELEVKSYSNPTIFLLTIPKILKD